MTRNEFDTHYAATHSNTECLTDQELSTLNDCAYKMLSDYDLDDSDTEYAAMNAFDCAHNSL